MPADPPNVVFVMADQMRAEAMGCLGNDQVETPHIDEMADDGILFTRAYSNDPICSPARGCLFSGRFSHKHGVILNSYFKVGLPSDTESLSRCLSDAGYHTGYIGKWHLYESDEYPGFVPPERRHGFDFWSGFGRGHDHAKGHPEFSDDGTEMTWNEGYQPAVQTDIAIDYLEERTDSEDPFALFMSWGPPHGPLEGPDEYLDRYDPEDVDLRPNVPADHEQDAREKLADYYGVVESLDDNLGRLLAALDDLGVADETLVCFTSDHGDMCNGFQTKGVPLEESIHVPLVMRYPDGIDPGRESDAPVGLIDLMPTLLSSCDVPIPEGVQGRDLTPHIDGQPADWDSVYLQGRLPDDETWRAIRTDRHLFAIDRHIETQHLYDMAEDPYQQTNLAGDPAAADIEEELRERLFDAMHEYDDREFIVRKEKEFLGTT
jgi:arylsulfatase A-like enzyme